MKGKLVFLFLLGMAVLFSGNLMAEGKLQFKETSLHFGEVTQGQVADLKFEFSNTGDSVLTIKQVHATCGCTVAQLDKKEYRPGEGGVIPVRFFSRGYSGRVIKTLVVVSSDKDSPKTRLQITGMVKVTDFADIEISQKEVNLGKLTLGTPARQQLTVGNPGNLELRITQVRHAADLYLIFPKTRLEPGETITVELVYNPSRLGSFSTYVFITSNALGKGEEMFRVEAEVKER